MNERKKITNSILLQAQVLWPADMPDNMLEDAIAISKKALDENEFESNGVEVSSIKNKIITAKILQIAKTVKLHMD